MNKQQEKRFAVFRRTHALIWPLTILELSAGLFLISLNWRFVGGAVLGLCIGSMTTRRNYGLDDSAWAFNVLESRRKDKAHEESGNE